MKILNKVKNRIKSIHSRFKIKTHKNNIKILNFIKKNDVEISMLIGVFFIIMATFKINFIAGLYIVGTIFVLLSVFLLKYPQRRR